MKKVKLFVFSLLTINLLVSCGGKSNCIKKAMDDGYSYEEAKELCEEAQLDGQLRGGGN